MYLRGSKWNMTRRARKPSNPLKLIFLVVVIGAVVYFNQIVVPTMPLPFIPTSTPTRSPESFLNEAEEQFNQGKLSQAIESYQQAILADPRNPATFVALARVQIFAGLYEEARLNAENALLLNENNSMAHAFKAWALDFQGDYPNALTAIRKSVELDPNNPYAYAIYAEILIDQGNYEDIQAAIDYSRTAQSLAPTLLETHRVRGYVLYATGNYADAVQEYQLAIAVNDKLWDLHYSLGVVYKLTSEYDLAVQEMLAAVALNPTNPDILTEISRTYASQGQYGLAVQYAEQAVSIDPTSPRLHGNLGTMYYKNGDYSRAAEELSLAVRGGSTPDGDPVEGLALAPGRVADDYYSIYALSLTKMDRCALAIPIMQLILTNIADDQVAYYNATEGMAYCRETIGTPQAEVTVTPTP